MFISQVELYKNKEKDQKKKTTMRKHITHRLRDQRIHSSLYFLGKGIKIVITRRKRNPKLVKSLKACFDFSESLLKDKKGLLKRDLQLYYTI